MFQTRYNISFGPFLVSFTALLCLAFLACYTVVSAIADQSFRLNTPESVRRAVQMMPGNADYHEVLAEHLEGTGVNPDEELRIVTELDPRESRYWIRRSFRAEVEQNFDDAERYLLKAYGVDHGFDPRWALMNYYFRRGHEAEFWRFAKEAFVMSYGVPIPIFRLCLLMRDDPSLILQALQGRRDLLSYYFQYFANLPRLSAAAAAAPELALSADTEELPQFITYCNQQIGQDTESALTVWNSLCRRHLLPFQELTPAGGNIITNPDLAVDTLKQGFDWKPLGGDGVSISPSPGGKGLTIELTGQQPDHLPLMEQFVPLSPGLRYAIDFDHSFQGAAADSGLRWAVYALDSQPGAPPLATSAVLTAADGDHAQVTFEAGHRNIARLVLEYRRALGTVRWHGTIGIRRISSRILQSAAVPGE